MFKTNKKLILAAAISSALGGMMMAPSAMATNGMNMEGYGAEATAMGGASMAYDNGVAAVMNNPATLGLAGDGDRLDVAVGMLAPTIETSPPVGFPVPAADSSGGPYIMPALGWTRKVGKMAYGVGMFSQGGMGTDYKASSFLAAGSNEEVRSEVGVGRLIAPLAYNVDSKLTVGGSIDFVWAGMDLKMAMPGGLNTPGFTDGAPGTFLDFMPSSGNVLGTATGSLINTFGGAIPGAVDTINWARFDFSDDNDFTGEAKSTGFGAKIGAVYKINNMVSIGGTYHSKTSLGDMESDDARLSMNIDGGGVPGGPATVNVSGKISINDFQWPEMFAFGAAFQVNDKIMLAADYKLIKWSGVMDEFSMTFDADAVQADPLAAGFGLGSTSMDVTMYQDWDDQNVFMLGGAFKVMPEMTLRAGVNIANNPVPDEYMNPLFPAIIEDHIALGMGYTISKQSTVDVSLVIAPEVEQTNVNTQVTSAHSQQNWQLVYSYRF